MWHKIKIGLVVVNFIHLQKTFYEHCVRVHALLKNVHTFVEVLEEMQQTAQIISFLGVN